MCEAALSLLKRLLGSGVRRIGRERAETTPGARAAPVSTGSAGETSARARADVAAGRFGNALSILRDALAVAPAAPELLLARVRALYASGRIQEARDACSAIALGGEHDAQRRYLLGQLHLEAGAYGAAEVVLRPATQSRPDDVDARCALAFAMQRQHRHSLAKAELEDALAFWPEHFGCRMALGNCLLEMGSPAAAATQFQRAVSTDESSAIAWVHLGVALDRADRPVEALAAFERAAALEQPGDRDADIFVNLAIILHELGRTQEAIELCERELPARPSVHGFRSYATAMLAVGRLAEAWPYFEFRWLAAPQVATRPAYGRAIWSGQPLHGRTILLHSEQGAGDVILFARYAPVVKALGATVMLVTPRALSGLARGFRGVDRLLGPSEQSPNFDFYVPLLSLPRVFETTVETIPAGIPYLQADTVLRAEWSARIGACHGLKVGLVWAGNPGNAGDRHRSMSLQDLWPLAEVSGVRWYALQKGAREDEVRAAPPGFELVNVGPDLRDFADTAAVVDQLDLLISVDTSVAHIAGALGKPVWLLIGVPTDWRWLMGRDDSPWYPTMRCFRQRERGNWGEVVLRVKSALVEMARGDGIQPSTRAAAPAVVPVPPARLPRLAPGHRPGMAAVAETRHGILQYLPDEPDIGDALGWYGEWLEPQLRLLSGHVRAGSTVLEVGAGIGAHSVWLGTAAGEGGRLLVSEASPVARRIVRQNLAANFVQNAAVLNFVLGLDDAHGESVDGLQLSRLDWLKISGGANALRLLEGAERTLWMLRPSLLADARESSDLEALRHLLSLHGYRCWRHVSSLYDPANFNRRESDIFAGRQWPALLAIPEEADVDLAPGDGLALLLA